MKRVTGIILAVVMAIASLATNGYAADNTVNVQLTGSVPIVFELGAFFMSTRYDANGDPISTQPECQGPDGIPFDSCTYDFGALVDNGYGVWAPTRGFSVGLTPATSGIGYRISQTVTACDLDAAKKAFTMAPVTAAGMEWKYEGGSVYNWELVGVPEGDDAGVAREVGMQNNGFVRLAYGVNAARGNAPSGDAILINTIGEVTDEYSNNAIIEVHYGFFDGNKDTDRDWLGDDLNTAEPMIVGNTPTGQFTIQIVFTMEAQ